jgi:TetR/AcrR family transcriptional regulator, transcriptional repressor for nem operon
MRYTKDHKEQVRQQLLAKSGRHAKKHGFAASGVDALAGAAGLTTGSLYKHFDNKNALFSALIEAEILRTTQRFSDIPKGDIEAILLAIDSYLSMKHVRSPEHGCPLPSLAPEVARASDDVRVAFEASMLKFKNILAEALGSSDAAWTLIAQSVGAIMMARAMKQESVKGEIIEASKASAADLVQRTLHCN